MGELTVYRAESARAAIVLGHGAGAGQASPFMVDAARGLAARRIAAATFDFPYITARRRVPDRNAVLEARWEQAIHAARREFGDLPVFIGGKSMGGRIASQVAARRAGGRLAGLVFFGYPLHPPGKPEQRRDAHLPSIAEPVLFIQGSRDAFGTSAEIRALIPQLARAALHEVAGGDHSLKVPGHPPGAGAVFEQVLDAAAEWMLTIARGALSRDHGGAGEPPRP